MKKIIFPILITAFVVQFSVSCDKVEVQDRVYTPRTAEGAMLKESPVISTVFADTTYVLTPGLYCTEVHLETMKGQTQHLFIAMVDMSKSSLDLKVATAYDSDVLNTKQTPTEMAAAADKSGNRVMLMVNGDFFNTSNTELRGPMHRRGRILKSTFSPDPALPQQVLSCIGVKADKSMVLVDAIDYPAVKDGMMEATGGGVVVLRSGQVMSPFPQLDPRTVMGYNNETKMACLMCVDGRSILYSNGVTYAELGSMMLALGMTDAVNFDGGGSTQFLIKNPVAGVWQIRNRPTDGQQRAVANCWMVTADMP